MDEHRPDAGWLLPGCSGKPRALARIVSGVMVRSVSEEFVQRVRQEVVGNAVPFTGDAAVGGVRHILEAAREVFLSSGYPGTSMDDVAAAAGVSKVTIYKHFTDKHSLFARPIRCSRLNT